MYMKNYFERLVSIVADLSEMPAENVLFGKKTDAVVDASFLIREEVNSLFPLSGLL